MLTPDGQPVITGPWATANVRKLLQPAARCHANDLQIVYVSIMGPVMLAAFLEWFLWLAAFLYCLVKVFQKAESTSIKVLAVLNMIAFTALRYVRPIYSV